MTEGRDSDWRRARCHALWLHQKGFCFHCGIAMPDPSTQRPRHRLRRPDSATIEHIYPRPLGGRTDWLNEVAACRACNSDKADTLPLPIHLWRLAWLKGAPLHDFAADPARLLAELSAPKQPGPPEE